MMKNYILIFKKCFHFKELNYEKKKNGLNISLDIIL